MLKKNGTRTDKVADQVQTLRATVESVSTQVAALLRKGKGQYDQLDPATKRRAAAVLVGLAALLAARSVTKSKKKSGKK